MINPSVKKIIKSRVFEIKVDIFQNYKGFKSIELLNVTRSKNNFFSNTFYNQKNQISFYKNLKSVTS